MLINLYISLHMQNRRIYLTAAEAAGARGEPGNGTPSLKLTDGPDDAAELCL